MMTGALRGTDPLEAALPARGQAGPGHLGPEVALLRTAEAGTGSRGLPEATTVMPRLYTTSEQFIKVSRYLLFNCVMHHKFLQFSVECDLCNCVLPVQNYESHLFFHHNITTEEGLSRNSVTTGGLQIRWDILGNEVTF